MVTINMRETGSDGNKIRVAVLFGGRSAEHEISLLSAINVIDAIDKDKYEPILIGIDKNGSWLRNQSSELLLNSQDPRLIRLNPSSDVVALTPRSQGRLSTLGRNAAPEHIDVVFPILHGPLGEDGAVQGLLKLADVPFVGTDVLGSAIGMDKDVTKRLLRDAGFPIARFITCRRANTPTYEYAVEQLGAPLFIKPATLGSSIGVGKVDNAADFSLALDSAFQYDAKVLIEETVSGREIECAVLGNESPVASVPGEIISSHEFYSYEAKYIDTHGAQLDIPAKLSADISRRVQELAVQAFKTLECEGLARVDFFLRADGTLLINEINTMPGFTRISMYPRLWEISGTPYPKLIDQLIQLALARFERDRKLQRSVSPAS